MTKSILLGTLCRTAALAAISLVVGCSSIGSATLPDPKPTGAAGLQVSPGSLSMGPGDAASLSANESGYNGTYTSTDNCSGIASVAPLGLTQFTVTAIAPGLCTITVSDSKGNAKQVGVSVQTTVIGGQ
jgi:hypothetical protein